jgi:hypothetical protein
MTKQICCKPAPGLNRTPVSNAARMFTTRSRPVFTTRSRQMFTTDVRPVFTTNSRLVFTTDRIRREMSGRRWRISFRSFKVDKVRSVR